MAEFDNCKSKNISIIVQGAINKTETPKCLKSIRKYLPDAEIVLSTWEGSDVSFIEGLYDILIFNKDPGAVTFHGIKEGEIIYNNLNRQILSTQEGLKKATRKYVMKLRSDLIFKDARVLDYLEKFPKKSDKYNLFTQKIITSSLFTRYKIHIDKNNNVEKIPFHISDWWFLGLKEDVEKYIKDTPLVDEPNFTKYFDLEENKNKKSPYMGASFKFAPEQYLGYSCFSRNFNDIYMEDASDYNDEIFEKSRECIVNNFIILEFKQSGIFLNKYFFSKNEKSSGEQYLDLYNFYRYECEYKEFCDNEYIISSKDFIFKNKDLLYATIRIYKHFARIFDKRLSFIKKLEQLVLGLPFAVLNYIIVFIKSLWSNKTNE